MNDLDLARKLPNHRAIEPETLRLTLARIEGERKIKGISREALAHRAGIAERTFNRYITGERKPAAKFIRALARGLAMPQGASFDDAWIGTALAGLDRYAHQGSLQGFGVAPGALKIYLAHVELGLEQRRVARLLNFSPAWISSVVRQVEDARDANTALNQALDALGMTLRLMGAGHAR